MKGRHRRFRLWKQIVLAYTVVSVVACSSSDPVTPTRVLPEEAAEADLGALPGDRAAVRAWLDDNEERVRDFEAVASQLTGTDEPEECLALAERFNAELGPVSEHLEKMSASPDPVLAELLVSSTVSARTIIAGCEVRNTTVVDDERPGLANALVLIERRLAQLREGS